ncbi:DUF6397 family protein [Streptomyces sp. NPDC051907]|uniref:DUF6397 family protein n=1 Tax=Streptomyces sp. NPDC051907 TaxID=3155284 RepID=UPI0034449CC6
MALELKRGELDLAVQLGHIRTVPDAGGGPPRVDQQEIDRLRAAEGFPDSLRERVRTVGTVEGARLIDISPSRFTRLARTGHFTPIRFYLNRYRAVVWLYLAEEVSGFAAAHADLLTGRTPAALRTVLDAGEDRRARNWRSRRLGLLLRRSEDPWQRAAAISCVLDPLTVAEVAPDPYERSHLRVLRPELVPGRPESPAASEVVERLILADHPDEILWHRVSLADALREARALRPAPRPEPKTGSTAHGSPAEGRTHARSPYAFREPAALRPQESAEASMAGRAERSSIEASGHDRLALARPAPLRPARRTRIGLLTRLRLRRADRRPAAARSLSHQARTVGG